MDQISLFPLHPDDIEELITVARRAWHAHYPGIISVEQIEYMLGKGYTRRLILDEIEQHGITWLTIQDGPVIIGLISLGPYGGKTIKLHKLYLLPEYHGKGIGAMALSKVEQIARSENCSSIVLNVNKHNTKAIRAYERAGWRITEQVVNDIGDGFFMDDYVMSKQIEMVR